MPEIPHTATIPSELMKTIRIKGRKIVHIVSVKEGQIAIATVPKGTEVQWEFAYVQAVDNPVNKSPTTRE